ncbi:MAG: helix-turn-helix domain-containing protein [Clostridia bacterium]
MTDFEIHNISYNVFAPSDYHVCKSANEYTFILFQGPCIINSKKIETESCILYGKNSLQDYIVLTGFASSTVTFAVPDEIISEIGIKLDEVYYPDNCEYLNYMISVMYREASEMRKCSKVMNKARLIEFLVSFIRGTEPETRRLRDLTLKNKMSTLRSEYLADPANAPDINYIIRRSGMSRTRFYELYNRFFNTSPKDDLIWVKLDKAKGIIADNPNLKMYEVAEQCGFCDVSHFLRTFKQHFGFTPKEYAQKIKNSGCLN